MKKIKILHLFPRLLSLYGEYGNISFIKLQLEKAGYKTEIDSYEDGELQLNNYDLIYIGSGTEKALLNAAGRLMPYKDEIVLSVKSGAFWLCTGNAQAIFGQKIETDGKETDGLGIFDYITKANTSKRFSGDVLTDSDNIFGTFLLGYVNTANVYTGIKEAPLCRFTLGKELGNDKKSNSDGFISNSFYATQLTGPLLVKNPAAARFFIEKLTGTPFELHEDSNAVLAYSSALRELTKRVHSV
ncbi:MAG: hypothetical protein J1E34_08515 [Oscillospiraceae bacterium]|nr:hypothetical protein [Oscillospiraceae bacterium]